jgi:hypothetical protein
MRQNEELLIPVDKQVSKLQREVDNMYWEGEDAKNLEWELRHFLKLQAAGTLYEARF